MLTTLLGLLWGLAQGMRHALEPDHLAAVSTLVAERRSARSAASYAVAWGLGHALALPATVIAGVFGTNFDNVPGLHSNWGFAGMLAGMGTIALAMAWYFKRSEWW